MINRKDSLLLPALFHSALLLGCVTAALCLLPASAARAKIPAQSAAKDDLGANIQGVDTYVLPKGAIVYHGTINVFPAFKARGADTEGLEQGTWFGADGETSGAMAYKKLCEQKTFEKAPKLLTVKVLTDMHFLLVPWGKTGHDEVAKLIGTRVRKSDRILNGVGVNEASRQLLTDICKTSVYVNEHHRIVAYTRGGKTCKPHTGIDEDHKNVATKMAKPTDVQKAVACEAITPSGTPFKLSGWRAPWDQNEIAVCGEDATDRTFEISPTVQLTLPVENEGQAPSLAKTCDKKIAPMRTKGVNKNRGDAFDIVFLDEAFWETLAEELLPPKSRTANATFVKVVSNDSTHGTLIDIDLANTAHNPSDCVLLHEGAPSYWQVTSVTNGKAVAKKIGPNVTDLHAAGLAASAKLHCANKKLFEMAGWFED